MAVKKIRTGANDPVLRQKSAEVVEISPEIKGVVFDLLDTVKCGDISVGLAAPQIGQSLRIIVVRRTVKERPQALINPRLIKQSWRAQVGPEACLSLPNVSVPVKRPVKIAVEALDMNGQTVKFKTRGFLARVIQHEIDHLDGILIVDKQEPVRS